MSRQGRRTPAERRTPTSQKSTSSAKAGTKYRALHFTAQAQPISTPAASRHHGQVRQPVGGRPARPGWLGSSPSSRARAQRRRRASRSSTSAPNAASTKKQQEDVEQRRAGQHQVEAVQREQQAGRAAEHRRAEHPPTDADQQQHRQRADHRRREPPAELRCGGHQVPGDGDLGIGVLIAEGPLAERRSATCPAAGAPRTTGRCPCSSTPRHGRSARRRPWRSTSRRRSCPWGWTARRSAGSPRWPPPPPWPARRTGPPGCRRWRTVAGRGGHPAALGARCRSAPGWHWARPSPGSSCPGRRSGSALSTHSSPGDRRLPRCPVASVVPDTGIPSQ